MKIHTFIAIGGLAAVLFTVYEVYRKRNISCEIKVTPTDRKRNYTEQQDFPVSRSSKAESDISETGRTVASSIRERHSAAAKEMEESLRTIFSQHEEEDLISENSYALNKVGEELNEL